MIAVTNAKPGCGYTGKEYNSNTQVKIVMQASCKIMYRITVQNFRALDKKQSK